MFEGNLNRRDDEVHVIGHHDKFMQSVASLCRIAVQNVKKQFRQFVSMEESSPFPALSGYEICPEAVCAFGLQTLTSAAKAEQG